MSGKEKNLGNGSSGPHKDPMGSRGNNPGERQGGEPLQAGDHFQE